MNIIHVVHGVGTTPTEMASYDTTLAAINIHNYNPVAVSPAVLADATIEAVGVAPDPGPAGNRLTIAQVRGITATPDETVITGPGQVTGSDPGSFYGASRTDGDNVHATAIDGPRAGRNLQEWSPDDKGVTLATDTCEGEGYITAVTVAAYEQSKFVF